MKAKIVVKLLLLGIALMVTGCATYAPGDSHPGSITEEASGDSARGALEKLIDKGRAQRLKGEVGAAAATLERALRLSPFSIEAYLELAQVRLDQKAFSSAEQLAQKALSFMSSSENPREYRSAWLLVAKARRGKGDMMGAQQAQLRADELVRPF